MNFRAETQPNIRIGIAEGTTPAIELPQDLDGEETIAFERSGMQSRARTPMSLRARRPLMPSPPYLDLVPQAREEKTDVPGMATEVRPMEALESRATRLNTPQMCRPYESVEMGLSLETNQERAARDAGQS